MNILIFCWLLYPHMWGCISGYVSQDIPSASLPYFAWSFKCTKTERRRSEGEAANLTDEKPKSQLEHVNCKLPNKNQVFRTPAEAKPNEMQLEQDDVNCSTKQNTRPGVAHTCRSACSTSLISSFNFMLSIT